MISRCIKIVSRETVLLPVHAWRLISQILPPRCRYHPSCSSYCVEAVRTRGVLVGASLAIWRVVRCNPWSYGGFDPVPSPPGPGRSATKTPRRLRDKLADTLPR